MLPAGCSQAHRPEACGEPGGKTRMMHDYGELTIGKLASRFGITVETIRYYEKYGLLAAEKRLDNNYRTFTPSDIERLEFIIKAKRCGFTLGEIKKILSIADSRISLKEKRVIVEIINAKISELDGMIDNISQIRGTLKETIAVLHNESRKECSSIDFLFRKK
jgi:MerR family Zn(II)-responsive transcriptional regulator of zntA